jgi:Calcineurin-like phosphoesterase
MKLFTLIIFFFTLVVLKGCGGGSSNDESASQTQYIYAAWVIIGSDEAGNNRAFARVATSYLSPSGQAVCPQINIDGRFSKMAMRAAAGLMPLRTTYYQPSVPANFPLSTCEAILPTGTQFATVAGLSLPVPKERFDRVLLIGDSGCRMDTTNLQNCDDPQEWPFASLAQLGAELNPDLVIHTGDYQYREVPCTASGKCPVDETSPWGYGWDTWNADLFTPAAVLLTKAPWVVIRGNHEICSRAGQGWFRFLNPAFYAEDRSCNDANYDSIANYSPTYAVSLGGGSRIVVFDSSNVSTGTTVADPNNNYYRQFVEAFTLAANPIFSNTIFTNHHPILGYSIPTSTSVPPGNSTLQGVMNNVMQKLYPAVAANTYYPESIKVAFHGHVHSLQTINFIGNSLPSYPATIVSGGEGDSLATPFPNTSPLFYNTYPVAPGVTINNMIWNNDFSFSLLERIENSAFWKYTLYNKSGDAFAVCAQVGRQLNCTPNAGNLSPS